MIGAIGFLKLRMTLSNAFLSFFILFIIPVFSEASLVGQAGFNSSAAVHGAFGGGSCKATKTPVIFIHGNGDSAENWNKQPSSGGPSVLESFLAAGYKECELFGVTFLSKEDQAKPQNNYHKVLHADRVGTFIEDVLEFTGARSVDIVSHSLGVTTSLNAIERGNLWPRIRSFIAISGALRGLNSCLMVGPANPIAPTCAAESAGKTEFGFFPHGELLANNPRMGDTDHGFVNYPKGKSTNFYSISAGDYDEIVCSGTHNRGTCAQSSLFNPNSNVVFQAGVGEGNLAPMLPVSDVLSSGGDGGSGVGHMRSKTDTAQIQINMLLSQCSTKESCCAGYSRTCEAK